MKPIAGLRDFELTKEKVGERSPKTTNSVGRFLREAVALGLGSTETNSQASHATFALANCALLETTW
jgi:hypothetical protein